MDADKQALLTLLTEWSKLSNADGNTVQNEIQTSPDAQRLYAISTAGRGKSQPLPSHLLLPV